MHHVVFLDRATLNARVREFGFPHAYAEYDATGPLDVVERLKDADIVITNKVPLRAETLKRLPNLKMIAVAATGTDIIDKKQASEQGIVVSNIRGYAVNTVPEHTFALIFALRRALLAYHEDVRRGRWAAAGQFCFFDHPIRDLAGSTLGLVGYGALGRSVAGIARALGMKVIHTGRAASADAVDLDTLLRASDIVSLHCPLTDATRNMIGEAELRKMKRDALLINTARGGLVDEAALAKALKEGWIGGAGFDVLTTEPPRDGNALLDPAIPNLLVTPHVAWASQEAMQTLSDMLVDNIEAFVAGRPQNVVAE